MQPIRDSLTDTECQKKYTGDLGEGSRTTEKGAEKDLKLIPYKISLNSNVNDQKSFFDIKNIANRCITVSENDYADDLKKTIESIEALSLNKDYNVFGNEGDSSIVQEKRLKEIDYPEQALKIYGTETKEFLEIYQTLKINKDELSSIVYGQKLKKAEDSLFSVKKAMALDPACGDAQDVETMQKQFEELYHNNPKGPSTLLRRDIERLQGLSKRPQKETYVSELPSTKGITYYEPKISLTEIMGYFGSFRSNWGYIGTEVTMKADGFYDLPEYKNKNFTLVCFKKPKNDIISIIGGGLLSVKSFFVKIDGAESSLSHLVNIKYSEWGYSGFEIFNMSEIREKLEKKGIYMSERWAWGVMLHHKKI